VPNKLKEEFSKALCFGFGVKIPDGDHYFCFFKNEVGKYVLMH
jgi:hypothetical protein